MLALILPISPLFQFHKVRLKDSYRLREYHAPNLFQFHKVRLKDEHRRTQRSKETTFQFHKVRLKAKKKYQAVYPTVISIP